MKVTLKDIKEANERIQSIILRTEMSKSHSASQLLGTEVYFKYENQQRTGSFKIRGAYNKISQLTSEEKLRGVVASSAGNHAQGVALSAQLAGVKSTIVMPENAPLNKTLATKGYGASVVLHGEIYDDSYAYAKQLEKEKGYVFVHPYEDEAIIAGQGTIGLEMFDSVPDLDTVIVSIGGGGVISGIACALKALHPSVKIIGVQSSTVPSVESLFNKKEMPVYKKKISTIADGIAVKTPSKKIFDSFISKYVDEIVTVTEDEIAEAIVFLLERAKTVAEGSGAATFAAAMHRKLNLGKKTGIVLTGGNIDLNIVSQVIQRGQIQRGRLAELSVIVDDTPGSLSRLTKAIADQKANILEVHHDRVSQGLFLRETKIDFVIETLDHHHIEKVRFALTQAGGKL